MHRRYPHLVTLDGPTAEGGPYQPLDPPDWHCAWVSGEGGNALLLGRYHAGITTATRVHFKGRVYHVDQVTDREERGVDLQLTCREVFDGT